MAEQRPTTSPRRRRGFSIGELTLMMVAGQVLLFAWRHLGWPNALVLTTLLVLCWRSPPKIRFSLRTLLIVMTLFGVGFGLHMYRRNLHANTIKELTQSGALFSHTFYDPIGPDFMWGWFHPGHPPKGCLSPWVEKCISIKVFANLWDNGEMKDADYRLVRDLKIESVHIDNDKVTDDALQHLRGADLALLQIDSSQVTNYGLQFLNTESLEYLTLEGPQFSDACLPYLSRMQSLKYICLWNTSVTDKEVARLKTAIPHCNVEVVNDSA